jgi:hypothetical protein
VTASEMAFETGRILISLQTPRSANAPLSRHYAAQ